MEPRQSFAELVNRPELAMGTNLKSGSPVMAEALGYSDLDFLLIDRQHGSPLMEGLEEVVRAADLQDVPVVVRTPKDDTSMITYLLDNGVRGLHMYALNKWQACKQVFDNLDITQRAGNRTDADRSLQASK